MPNERGVAEGAPEEDTAMQAIDVEHVTKSYAGRVVVDDVSLSVEQGEIFGLIGPNGAGKTTTIRMMMDIIKPDSGQVMVLGKSLNETTKNRLGYLPEERGLYKRLRVMDSIFYLASLKGQVRSKAEARANELLSQTGMLANKNKKIDELSKGMGQIIQFIVTIVHDPDLVILDEPFSGLDPVNTEILKTIVVGLRDRGKTVVLSTHQMNQVEELCDRVLMIDKGRSVLYGTLRDIKAKFRGNSLLVECEGDLPPLSGISGSHLHGTITELVLEGGTSPKRVLEELVASGVAVTRFEVASPSLNEIFVRLAGTSHE